MDFLTQMEDLRAAAEKLAIEIQMADLADNELSIKSGYCKLRGESLILLDKRLSPEGQVQIVLQALRNFDLEPIYVASWIREALENTDFETDDTAQ